jgi:hypothetical protein
VREPAYLLVRRSLPQARRTRLKAQIAHWRQHLMSPGELMQWRFHGVSLLVTSAARVTEVLIDAASRGEIPYAT